MVYIWAENEGSLLWCDASEMQMKFTVGTQQACEVSVGTQQACDALGLSSAG